MQRRLLGFLRPHAGLLLVTLVSRVLAAVLDALTFVLLIPFLELLFSPADASLTPAEVIPGNMGFVGDILSVVMQQLLVPDDPRRSLLNVILLILTSVIVKNFFVWWGGVTGARLQEYVSRDMRDTVFSHVIRLPMPFHSRTRVGQLISRIISDTDQTRQVITHLVTQGFQSAATVVASVVVLTQLSFRLTLISLVIAPLLILALQPLLRRLRRGYRRVRNDLGELTSLLQEVLAGARLVKSYGAEEFEAGRFGKASRSYTTGLVRVTKYTFLSQPITEILGTLVAVFILWLGANLVFDGSMAGPTLMAFLAIVLRLLQPLKQLSQVPAAAQNSLAAGERLFEMLDQPTEDTLDTGTIEKKSFTDAINFDGVSFSYAAGELDEVGPAAVADVTFSATRGQMVALVGPSGAGKSTLVDLIPRFHEPSAGTISIDSVSVRDIRLQSLRRLIGIVSQETVLFNDTVRNNIAYGAHASISDEQLGRVAELANAHEFIARLPQGYDTVLGERGSTLSGGQRQRISIARALLADPPILIFDEATSALDTESERLVQQAMDRLLEGRTVIVVAHRLSTIVNADLILVMDRGRIVERGTHGELLALGGLYSRLHALQPEGPTT